MGETTSSAPHSRAHDKNRNPFHRNNRAPRRTRFSGRTTPGGESLDTHTAAQAAKESKDTPDTTPATESAAPSTALETTESSANAPATAATPTALSDSPRDTDLRVDALEIGPRNRRLTRFLGERLYDKLGPSATYVRRSASFLLTSPGRLTTVALILIVAIPVSYTHLTLPTTPYV